MYLRRETGAYLDPWHDRLKTAYVDTLADLGVTRDLDDRAFLAAMEQHKQVDPALAAVLTAIKATVKGGVGELRERPQVRHYKDGERWPALSAPDLAPGHPRRGHRRGPGQLAPQAQQHGEDDGLVPARGAVRLRRLPQPRLDLNRA